MQAFSDSLKRSDWHGSILSYRGGGCSRFPTDSSADGICGAMAIVTAVLSRFPWPGRGIAGQLRADWGLRPPVDAFDGVNHEVCCSPTLLLDLAILAMAIVKPWLRCCGGSFAGP